MWTRLVSFSSHKRHRVIPVMVQSFMGPQHGRILQAHFDGRNLVIRKSQLYDLTKKDDAVIDLFLQQRMNEPVGT
ncbi:hypothetical protein M432DRAFT_643017 [Thermoascus aurantiacus ATCC 26904]